MNIKFREFKKTGKSRKLIASKNLLVYSNPCDILFVDHRRITETNIFSALKWCSLILTCFLAFMYIQLVGCPWRPDPIIPSIPGWCREQTKAGL